MDTKAIFGGLLLALGLVLPVTGQAVPTLGDGAIERILDENGEVVWEVLPEPSNPLLLKAVHYLRLKEGSDAEAAKPGSGGADPGTDCESDAYKTNGYHWTTAYSAYASNYASIIDGTLKEWDGHTAAAIAGGVTSGTRGEAGVLDGVNQLAWVNLGSSTTIAVTTTWYYRGSGEAVESDGEYNTYYPWATNGDAGAMDVENIAQHEVGHTYGLGHPTSTSANSCLTMYAYADYGETQKRTLGDGDILGIKAIYGN